MHSERGFTLIEMLIVLLIITVLILLILPNMADKTKSIHSDGCKALVQIVQAQVVAYELDHGKLPENLDVLVDKKYITMEQKTCKNKKALTLVNGIVDYAED